MTAPTDTRTDAADRDDHRAADRDAELLALQSEFVGCGMWPTDAAAQAQRELTIAAVRDQLAAHRAEFERSVPLALHEPPAAARRAHVWRVRLAVVGLCAVVAVPAAVLADGPAALLGWLLMAMFVVAGGCFVLLLTRTDHHEVDESLRTVRSSTGSTSRCSSRRRPPWRRTGRACSSRSTGSSPRSGVRSQLVAQRSRN